MTNLICALLISLSTNLSTNQPGVMGFGRTMDMTFTNGPIVVTQTMQVKEIFFEVHSNTDLVLEWHDKLFTNRVESVLISNFSILFTNKYDPMQPANPWGTLFCPSIFTTNPPTPLTYTNFKN